MPISISANQITTFANPHANRENTAREYNTDNLLQNRPDRKKNGYLSETTKSHIKKLVSNLFLWKAHNSSLQTSAPRSNSNQPDSTGAGRTCSKPGSYAPASRVKKPKKLIFGFITLTLQSKQIHTDNEIKRECLQPFIANLKRVYGMDNYIWVAETQDNGNIHFHLITQKYIDKKILQIEWNYYSNKLGYVDRSNSKNPPSTDVKSIRNIQGAAGYITKYITKGEEGKRAIEGRLWGVDTETEKMGAIILTDEEAHDIQGEITKCAIMEIAQEFYTVYIIAIYKSEILKALIISKLKERLEHLLPEQKQ